MQTWRIHRLLNIARDVDLSRFIKFSTPTRKARAREFHETRTKARASAHCLRNIYHRCIIQRGRIFAFEQSSIRSNFNEIEQPGQKCREIMALSWLIGPIIPAFFHSFPFFVILYLLARIRGNDWIYYDYFFILLLLLLFLLLNIAVRFFLKFSHFNVSFLPLSPLNPWRECYEWSWNSIKISPFFLIER